MQERAVGNACLDQIVEPVVRWARSCSGRPRWSASAGAPTRDPRPPAVAPAPSVRRRGAPDPCQAAPGAGAGATGVATHGPRDHQRRGAGT
jgi:hypothetical protein